MGGVVGDHPYIGVNLYISPILVYVLPKWHFCVFIYLIYSLFLSYYNSVASDLLLHFECLHFLLCVVYFLEVALEFTT